MKLRNLLAVSATAFTLLSCNDSDNHPTPGKGCLLYTSDAADEL